MKKMYNDPKFDLVCIANEDVLTLSLGDEDKGGMMDYNDFKQNGGQE